jgi:ABC-type multidrug transport system fused ATPase/permease subunit
MLLFSIGAAIAVNITLFALSTGSKYHILEQIFLSISSIIVVVITSLKYGWKPGLVVFLIFLISAIIIKPMKRMIGNYLLRKKR